MRCFRHSSGPHRTMDSRGRYCCRHKPASSGTNRPLGRNDSNRRFARHWPAAPNLPAEQTNIARPRTQTTIWHWQPKPRRSARSAHDSNTGHPSGKRDYAPIFRLEIRGRRNRNVQKTHRSERESARTSYIPNPSRPIPDRRKILQYRFPGQTHNRIRSRCPGNPTADNSHRRQAVPRCTADCNKARTPLRDWPVEYQSPTDRPASPW